MSILPIVKYGTPSLQEPSEPVKPEEINDDMRTLIRHMGETMYDAKGVGLAAPQIGLNIRLFVCDSEQVTDKSRNLRTFINPEIVEESVEDEPFTEGCLSIPGVEGEVWRPSRVKVRALDEQGKRFEVDADDLLARVIQHEIDHLDGVLFPERMAKEARAKIAGQLNAVRDATQANLDEALESA